VGAIGAVIWFQGRHLQKFADQLEIAVQQKGAVKEKIVFAATLGIAGEFQVAETEVSVAPDGYFVAR